MVWLIAQLQRKPYEKQERDVQCNSIVVKVREVSNIVVVDH